MANMFTRVWDAVRNKTEHVSDDLTPSVKPLKSQFKFNSPTTRSSFMNSSSNNNKQPLEQDYNLSIIDRFVDNESIVYQTFSKIEEKATNNGWQYVSKDQEAVDYVRRRFTEFARVTKKPVHLFIRQIIEDIVKYHNSFLYKMRDASNSTGRRVRVGDKVYEPIAAYVRLDPTAVIPERDKQGNVLRYYIGPTRDGKYVVGEGKFVPTEDVIHIYHLKSERNGLGTPYIWPVIDDIRVLRHMEENLELMIHKHMFPLYQYIIGTKEQPTEPEEIEKMAIDIENIPSEGGWVTPNRHDIKVIGAEGKALTLDSYLNFFRDRIIMGLGIGYVSFGLSGGASRASSEVIDRNLVEKAKLYQRIVTMFFNDIIVPELLAENGWDQYTDELPEVTLQFDEIDSDTQIKIENHALNMFNAQAIDYDELRTRIGEDTKGESDFSKLQFNMFGPAKLQEYDMELARIGAAQKAAASSSAGDSAKSTGSRAANAADKPSNQHGQKLSPKRGRDMVEDMNNSIRTMKESDNSLNMHKAISGHFDAARSGILTSISAVQDEILGSDTTKQGISYAMGMAANAIYNTSRNYISSSWDKGYVSSFGPKVADAIMKQKAQQVLDHHDKYIKKTLTDVENSVINILVDHSASKGSKEEALKKISSLFDLKQQYISGSVNASIAKAHNFGRALGFKDLGHKEAFSNIHEGSDCKDCQKYHGSKIDLQYVTVEDIPPHHQNCECTIDVKDINSGEAKVS